MVKSVLEDIFRVEKVFEKVTHIEARSEKFDMFMQLDINSELYPLKIGHKFSLALVPTLNLDVTPDTGYYNLGAGLWNVGNTCFLNSVLQCLTYTEPLATYLLRGEHRSSCRIVGFCALCAIQNHVSDVLKAPGRILCPQDMIDNLPSILHNFQKGRQEDAYEYMVNLLKAMDTCYLLTGEPDAVQQSLVDRIFRGRLKSQVQCERCTTIFNTYHSFLVLRFETEGLYELQNGFRRLQVKEKLHNCKYCPEDVLADKGVTIYEAPNVLAIQIKRFSDLEHKNDNVWFGKELNLKPYYNGLHKDDENLKYSLYGVLVHEGDTIEEGHYYCHVRTKNDTWYTLNDSQVSPIGLPEVLKQSAYMLFYVRDEESNFARKAPEDISKTIGAGLVNLGNTCYMNSILQCLTYTQPLAAYLLSGEHKSSCKKDGSCTLCTIQDHVSNVLKATEPIRPDEMHENLQGIMHDFQKGRQEDVHEYMQVLLESMSECCIPSKVPSDPNALPQNIVYRIFGGRHLSQTECNTCNDVSNKREPFLSLSLEMPRADSLENLLKTCATTEFLETKRDCEICNKHESGTRTLTIDMAPNVLAIQIKRFISLDKNCNKVWFGSKLDLKPYCSGLDDENLMYSLYGVLVHVGPTIRQGHYYCHVRTKNDTWYTLNDSQVRPVDLQKVLNDEAYMLFYVRDTLNIAQQQNVRQVTDQHQIVESKPEWRMSHSVVRMRTRSHSPEE